MLNFLFSSIAHKLPSVVTLKADLFEDCFYRGVAGCNIWRTQKVQIEKAESGTLAHPLPFFLFPSSLIFLVPNSRVNVSV
jgi:hypothetical protein